MKQKLFFAFLISCLSCAVTAENTPLEDFHRFYETLLESHTQEGAEKKGITYTAVDYGEWSQDPLHEKAMKSLRAINPAQLTEDERMAYWINAYNLLTVDLIVTTQEKKSIRNLGNFIISVWRKHRWNLFDGTYTLHNIEHDILRPLNDGRIHFAINCASLSCPDLRRTPYAGEELEEQLQEQTAYFINNPTKGFTWHAEKAVLSAVFNWYLKDFGGRDGVQNLIKEETGEDVREASRVKFMHYDWSLNGEW